MFYIRLLCTVLFFFTNITLVSAQGYEVSPLRALPILHEGRVKPFDTFARAELLNVSGRASLSDLDAMQWLCELLFLPARSFERSVMRIHNPDVVDMLKLEWRKKHLYSLIEVAKGLSENVQLLETIESMDKERRSLEQQQSYDLYVKTLRLYHLGSSFSFLEPQFRISSSRLRKLLDFENAENMTYLQLVTSRAAMMKLMGTLDGKKVEAFDPDELELFHLVHAMTRLERDGQNSFLRILPPQWKESEGEWLSPWGAMLSGGGSPQSAQYMKKWEALSASYQHDEQKWNEAIQHIHSRAPSFRLELETLLNRLDLFSKSLIFYGVAFLLLMISWMTFPQIFYRVSMILFSLGALSHIAGLVTRIVILKRPPVSSLYESILFVAFIIVVFGFILEVIRKNGLGLLIGTLSGTILLFISRGYADEGDTMGMLVAVLNTNFWLATHVVTITIGYGTSLVAGIMGHVYLVQRLFFSSQQKKLKELIRNMVGVTGVALFFTLFGTILGGIWADQSWGRFWGWDPKENGALLIVLWLLWLLHGRITKRLHDLGFACGMVLTNIIVALAWFGVNLLNVGLHSYGFTNHIALNLALFCGVELFFATTCYAILCRRRFTNN
ncbi:MAG: hypothetical protein A3I05_07930 [Deltaproteobacteria bacterium RIFCSPLOWO2_02_FULL_44_10]|nr:MAG: hypothetical protein A3C46_01780 [Deltaproteobacteria bacterium RIFCSPHIGHO2_02_FULL_44_16]OGQ45614.1 MAG: hypothetical protein A3I05_07930 [Deltaproteobacteria bacterium RIFCSPLOWO2_02_FULL_44_10]